MVADRTCDSRVVDCDDMTNDEPNSNEQNTHNGIYDFDGHREQSLSDLRVNQPSVKRFGPLGASAQTPICILQKTRYRKKLFGNR